VASSRVDPDRADDTQLAGRERAGLVCAQDGHAAQVLDGRQALDEHAAAAQRPRSLGQVERDDRRQELGRQADRKRDREQERIEERPLQGEVDREHGDHEDRS
jgi:hypothetical protein